MEKKRIKIRAPLNCREAIEHSLWLSEPELFFLYWKKEITPLQEGGFEMEVYLLDERGGWFFDLMVLRFKEVPGVTGVTHDSLDLP